jgi:hypothetical protein
MDALWPVKAIHLRAFPGLKIETWGTQDCGDVAFPDLKVETSGIQLISLKMMAPFGGLLGFGDM